mmetsp:Transcript_6161/g.14786  ORF Transcript_6161/g.14786 Transcript_6161/m.14786 type:complete len:221 (+) Transcript_6161:51-713(+)
MILSSISFLGIQRRRVPTPHLIGQLLHGRIQAAIDQNHIEIPLAPSVLQLRPGIAQPPGQRLLRLGTSATQSLLQILHAGRRHEHVQRIGQFVVAFDGSHALHVNVQDAQLALPPNALHGLQTGAVVIPMHLGIFEEFAVGDISLDLIDGDEMVVDAIDLARSGRPGGVRCREAEFGGRKFLVQDGVDDGALPDAAGAADYQWPWPRSFSVFVAVVFRRR